MLAEARDFLDALFGHTAQGVITLTAIHPARRGAASRHILLGDTAGLGQALSDLLAANHQGWGAYVGIGVRRAGLGRWRRGGKADVLSLPALFADLDTPSSLARLARFSLLPSCLVCSGHGWHAYWWLRPTTRLRRADIVLAGLAAQLGGDRVTVAQAMRLPGTLNTKAQPVPCRLETLYPRRVYHLDDFARYASPLPRRRPLPPLNAQHYDQLKEAVAARLVAHYGGYLKPNGWLAALCPCPHRRDWPGAHFNYHPALGVGHCFGRHGRLGLAALCQLLTIERTTHHAHLG